MPVKSANLQLMQHYIRPKFATASVNYSRQSLLSDAGVDTGRLQYMTPWRQRTASSVYTRCGYDVLRVAIGE